MKQLKSQKGFTLIELVVVIAILGILAGIAIPRFMDATATARGAKIVADLRTIDSSIMMYQAKTGSLPTDAANLTTSSSANGVTVSPVLAAWPAPPKGTAIITANDGSSTTISSDSVTKYGYTGTTGDNAGRATYNSKTVDQLLAKK